MTTEKMLGMAGAILGAVAVIGLILVATVWQPTAKPAPATQTFDIGIGHQDSYARPALVNIGAPEETKIATFYKWQPPVVVVGKGDTVVLNITNYSQVRIHSFVLPEFGLDTGEIPNTPAGATPTIKTLEFVADKAGIYEWACGVSPDPTVTPQKCSPEHTHQTGWLIVLER